LRHDARHSAGDLATSAVNDDARVATQHATVAAGHELLVDWRRHEQYNLLRFGISAGNRVGRSLAGIVKTKDDEWENICDHRLP
jgi:hypothetical protein